jgi:hypothetical protein
MDWVSGSFADYKKMAEKYAADLARLRAEGQTEEAAQKALAAQYGADAASRYSAFNTALASGEAAAQAKLEEQRQAARAKAAALSTQAGTQAATQASQLRATGEDTYRLLQDLAARAQAGDADAKAKYDAALAKYTDIYNRFQATGETEANKTTAQRLAESGAYAETKAQSQAMAATEQATRQAIKAARTAGMPPGQAALVAAQQAGATFSPAYQAMLTKFDEEYQSADAARREELYAQATQAANQAATTLQQGTAAGQAGIGQQAGIQTAAATQKTEAQKAAAAAEQAGTAQQTNIMGTMAGLDLANLSEQGKQRATTAEQSLQAIAGLNASQLDSIEQQIESGKWGTEFQADNRAEQEKASQEWARLSIQEKIAKLQEKIAKSQEMQGWVNSGVGALNGLLQLLPLLM